MTRGPCHEELNDAFGLGIEDPRGMHAGGPARIFGLHQGGQRQPTEAMGDLGNEVATAEEGVHN